MKFVPSPAATPGCQKAAEEFFNLPPTSREEKIVQCEWNNAQILRMEQEAALTTEQKSTPSANELKSLRSPIHDISCPQMNTPKKFVKLPSALPGFQKVAEEFSKMPARTFEERKEQMRQNREWKKQNGMS